MKIPASIRRLHEDQAAVNGRLKSLVDERMAGLRKSHWHYESRVKELSSFALKIESGRFEKPSALEDFFACTLVVANAPEIAEAEEVIDENFIIKYRRPKHSDKTHKTSDSFQFDDLRLYVTLRQNPALPPTDLADVVFEVQIKTFLQHAWGIATHDLLYKTDDVNWSKQRIAYQIKAMLEHAEISIQQAEGLAACAALAKEDPRTATIKEGIKLVKAQWGVDELPADVRRLAENVTKLLADLHVTVNRLEQMLEEGKARRQGAHPSNLSPYGTIIQYLFEAEKDKLVMYLKRDDKNHVRVLIPAEIDLPHDVNPAEMKGAVFVSENGA
jgi:ppGpp synthetase/RelA/SpoT-type nucleotidyltranferase